MARVIGTAVVEVRADTDGFRSALARVGSGVGALGAAVGAIGIAHLGKEAIQFGADTTIALDQARAMFRGLTSSEQEAQAVLERLTNYAIQTPFELPGVSKMAAQLVAVGDGFGVTTDNVTDYLTTIGNVTSASGGNEETMQRIVRVLGQMSSSGKVLGQDMNQLAQNIPGLDVWGALADGTGKSVEELRELQDAGKLDELLTGNEAVALLMEQMEKFPGAAGAMDRQMQTLGGSISKFHEQLALAMSAGLQPFFKVLQDTLANPVILSAIDGLIAAFAGLMSVLIAELAPALPALIGGVAGIIDAFSPLAPVIAELVRIVGGMLVVLAPVIKQIAGAIAALTPILVPLANLIIKVFGTAVELVMPILDVLVDLLLQIAAVVLPPLMQMVDGLTPIFALVGDTIAVLVTAVLPPLIDFIGQLLVAVEPLIPVLGELLTALIDALLPALTALLTATQPLFPIYVSLVENALVPLIIIAAQLATLLVNVVAPAFDFIAAAVRLFSDVLADVMGFVGRWVETVIGWFQTLYDILVGNSIIPDLINAIVGWFEFMSDVVIAVVEGVKTVVTAIWDAIKLSVETTINALATVISTVFDGIKATVETVWNGVSAAIIGPMQAAYDFVADIVGKIGDLVDDALGFIDKIPGSGIVKGIVSAIPGFAAGGIVNQPTLAMIGEGRGPEAIIPLTNPGRAMQLMQQSGLDRLAAQMNSGGRGTGGPLISMPGAIIQDATDADLVAQRTIAAMQAAMIAA
jgi:tape measure domain-containing protein